MRQRRGKIDNFSNKVIDKTKNRIAEFDITTSKYIIECKQGLSLKTVDNIGRKEEFLNQFLRYTDSGNINYVNFQNKKVILVIDKFTDGLQLSHPVFKELESIGVTILTDYKQLKNIK